MRSPLPISKVRSLNTMALLQSSSAKARLSYRPVAWLGDSNSSQRDPTKFLHQGSFLFGNHIVMGVTGTRPPVIQAPLYLDSSLRMSGDAALRGAHRRPSVCMAASSDPDSSNTMLSSMRTKHFRCKDMHIIVQYRKGCAEATNEPIWLGRYASLRISPLLLYRRADQLPTLP